jgi:RecA-family ATPase
MPEYYSKREPLSTAQRHDNAIEFLTTAFTPPWLLMAINPDRRNDLIAKYCHRESDARRFIEHHDGARNLYYEANPLKQSMNTKPSKSDIREAICIKFDGDPLANETPAQARKRYIAKMQAEDMEPTWLINSGNGTHGLYMLSQPVGPERFKELEERTRALLLRLGAKPGTQDVCRLMRLPGTINLPDGVKRKAGRLECEAAVIWPDDPKKPIRFELEDFPLPDKYADNTSASGVTPSEVDRSTEAFKEIRRLKAQGLTDDEIIGRMNDHAPSVEKYGQRLRGEVIRILDKIKDDPNRETRTLTMRSVREFEPRAIEWLWYPFIPFGMVTCLYGDGGLGKSTLLLDIAARISTGGCLPRIGDDKEEPLAQRQILILCKEDDVSRIIRPRLDVAGADLSRIHVVGYPVADNPKDFDPIERLDTTAHEVERVIRQFRGDLDLVICDAITDFVGNADAYSDVQVRTLLTPFGRFSAKYDFAFVYVLHLNKGTDQPARNRGMGSMAFRNFPRSRVLVARDDSGSRLMVQEKANLAPNENRAVRYDTRPARSNPAHPEVRWGDQWEKVDPDELLSVKKLKKVKLAERLLKEWLANGPLSANEVYERAQREKITKGTLDRAKDELHIDSEKDGLKGWYWRLPQDEKGHGLR